VIWLTFFLCQEFSWFGGLLDTRVSFLEKNFTSLAFSRHLGDLHIPKTNVNNQPAIQPANVGRQQQQGHQRERSNTAPFTSTEMQGLLQVIEEILPVHGKEWEDVPQSHATNFPTS
jgi:hypothetical protein